METAVPTSTLRGGRTPSEFLDAYWQKRPLLVRGALPNFRSPLAPEELAGLACEEGITSRIVMEKGGEYPWQLRHGPFAEGDFLDLPETHWTLLVQEVDRLIPEVGALLNPFRFIPRWRIDDVMVSYAPEGGSVGAHIDNYDVFLLQGLGHRRWQIGREPVEVEQIKPGLDVRILQDFTPDEEMVLEPGDMLYLPPRVAHYGVAEDDCMTYSIGFRAPSHKQIVGDYLSYLLRHIDPDARYSDPDLTPAEHPGALRPEALRRVQEVLRRVVLDDDAVARWFGEYVTSPDRGRFPTPLDEERAPEAVRGLLRQGGTLRRHPIVRMAYVEHEDGRATLFVGGEGHPLPPDMALAAPLLADRETIPAEEVTKHLDDDRFVELVTEFVNEGILEIET